MIASKNADLSDRSLIASLVGNVVGALLVGLPAVYLYLGDYNVDDQGIESAEGGSANGSEKLTNFKSR